MAIHVSAATHASAGTSARCLTLLLAAFFALILTACSGGSSRSTPAAAMTAMAPTITTDPATPQSVTVGHPVAFTVVAAGTAPLSYQWQRNGANLGGDAPTLTITAAQMADAGAYSVVVSNAAGRVTSAAASLTVSAASVAPTITNQSASQQVTVGDRVILLAAATGTAPLQYQWRKDGVSVGGDSWTYTLAAAQLADSGSYTATVTNGEGSVTSAPIQITVRSTVDATVDWKGLTAEEETRYGLNPDLLDTDGDGISDYDEIKTFGFDPTHDPSRFNPLVADMPSVKIELTSPPYFQIKYDYTDGSTASSSTERSTSSTQSVSTSVEAGVTLHQEATVATQATAKAGVLDWGGVQMTGTFMISSEESFTFSSEQAWENSQALTNAEAYENSHEVSASEAKMALTVRIRNTGHMAFTMKNLVLSGTTVDRLGASILRPVGNLEYEGNSGFPESTLAPGDSITGLTFSNRLLYVDTAKQMLKDSSNLYLGVAAYEIADPLTGLPSNAQMTEIDAKTAAILIDYDTYSGRDAEKFRVATNLVNGAPGVSLKTILERHLFLPYEAGTVNGKTGLKKLRTYDTSATDHTKWVITHVHLDAGEMKSDTYDLTVESYDLGAITVKAGDLVSLMYVVDKDGDGLPHRLERAMGTSDVLVDSIPGDAYPNDFAWYLAGHPVQDNVPDAKYQVVYHGNGHTGGLVPTDPGFYTPGQFIPVFDNPGGLVKINVGGISYRFVGWNTEPDGTGSSYSASKPYIMGSGSVILYAQWASYELGDAGPAGGKIFFKKDYYSDGWRYLEAAPYNQNGSNPVRWVEAYGVYWNAPNLELPGAWGRGIGDGAQNTLDLEKAETSYKTAADICANLVIGRYSDWFLPSYDELLHMRNVPGSLSPDTTYWTSTQYKVAVPNTSDQFTYYAWTLYNVGNLPALDFSVDYVDRQRSTDNANRNIKVRSVRRF